MKRLFLLMALAALAVCCGKKERAPRVPSPEFTAYVTAYTGGVISTSGTVRVELAHAQANVEIGAPVKEKLFSFSPSVKGEASWMSSNVIEFTPKEGALKSGTLYDVDFRFDKIEKVDKGLEVFEFSFRTKEQDFEILLDPAMITRGNPMVLAQAGSLVFGDVVDAKTVAKMVTFDGATPASVEPAEGKAAAFRFTFDPVQRPSGGDKTMEVVVKGKPAGIDNTAEIPVVVPATGAFRFMDAQPLPGSDNGLYLTFSEPLDQSQDLRGLISIQEIDEYVFQIEENVVMVHFQSSRSGSGITIDVERGIRSDAGDKLQQSFRTTLWMEAEKPAVEIISQGTIMPDSKDLVLAFRAVSLRAVDLKVIRIFESNVLMFLQTNTLESSDELRRSGRMVYNKPLQLQGARHQGSWQDYSIDLAPIIKQEPGAIYRIELSFKREYSTYACGEATPGGVAPSEGMVTLSAAMDEDSVWDYPQPYYWGGDDYDYDDYNWRERDDPCKPTYYMQSERKASANVMASNLGVIVKAGEGRRLFVAVTDILTTKPTDGANVTVYNYQLQKIGEGRTNAEGMVDFEIKGVGFVAVAEKEGWKTYVKLVDNEQNSLSRFDVGGKQIQKGLKGYVYGERGVWRPGDTLHLTLVVEDRLGRIPEGHPVTLELFNPRGQFHTRQVNARGVGGFYCFTVPTADSDPTGLWNAYFKVGGASFHKALRVETIKPNRLKIKFSVPGDKIDGSGRSTPATLDVSWLTGATARNLKASVEMSLVRGAASPFKGFERFTFNDPASSFIQEAADAWSGTVDGNGHAAVNLATPSVDEAPGVMRADVVCRVFEPGGDASIYVESFPFSPYSRYVGVDLRQKSGEYFETDVDNVFDI
ncbi:MAG: alpha-2-macroglobulin, partial [Rikenellaceae bacterium]|nr:alpha-2-macroglobulin [Rikenellaceae bacterium]